MNLAFVIGGILANVIPLLESGQSVKAAPAEQEVVFLSGTNALSGTVLLPRSPNAVPGIVIIHGSGESDRSNPWTRAYAEALSKRGIAVLHPDKRGCGKSQGDWRNASLLDLADDAIAALETLRKNDHINSAGVGLIGFSQGGHVLAAAASRSSNVAFVIDISGSVVPMAEQMADEVELSAERAGLTKAQIEIVSEINAKGIRFVETTSDEDWKDYESTLAKAKEGELKGMAVLQRFPTVRHHPALSHLRGIVGFDPMVYWKKVSVPAVFVFGGNDTQVRVGKSIERIRTELPADKFNYAVLLFAKNRHALYREDLCDLLTRWILEGGKP